MRKNIIKKITVFTAPILILTLILGIFFDKTYTSKNVENISVSKDFSKAIMSKECMATRKTSLYKKENILPIIFN